MCKKNKSSIYDIMKKQVETCASFTVTPQIVKVLTIAKAQVRDEQYVPNDDMVSNPEHQTKVKPSQGIPQDNTKTFASMGVLF